MVGGTTCGEGAAVGVNQVSPQHPQKDGSPVAVLLAPPGGAGRYCSEPAHRGCLLLPGPERLQSLHHHTHLSPRPVEPGGPGHLTGKDDRRRMESHEWPEDSMSPRAEEITS